MPHPAHSLLAVVPALLGLGLGGCDFVGRYLAGSPEDQLVKAVLVRWAIPGRPFLEGASGRDTVASVSATGARSWEVAVMPLSGGSPAVWALEVSKTETWPVFPGDAFGRFLGERARELGARAFLPPEILSGMASGAILGVGELEVRYGLSERSGRNTESRVAFLSPGAAGAAPGWEIQEVSRSAGVLLQALKTVTEDMIRRDDRVLSCMGGGTPAGIAREVQLSCIRKVWTEEFGQEP